MRMTEREYESYFERVRRGLDRSVEKILRQKALLDREVVYARPDGTPFTMPASEALNVYLAGKGERLKR